jgi:hypothetical protein
MHVLVSDFISWNCVEVLVMYDAKRCPVCAA